VSAADRAQLPSAGERARVVTAAEPLLAEHASVMALQELSPGTVQLRMSVLRSLARFVSPTPLLEVTERDLNGYQRALLGGVNGGAALRAESRRSYVCQLRVFYGWALDEGLIDKDPSRVLIIPKVPRGKPHPISEADLQRALAEAPPMVRVWLVLAAGAGLRAMEVAGLRREDIQDRAGTPHLVVRGKGSKTRIVPLSGWVLAELQSYGLPASGPLFWGGRTGAPVTAHAVSETTNRFLHRIGMPATIHKCRHRFATRLHRATRDIRLTQEMLGHVNLSTTAVYVDFDRDEAAVAIEGLTVGAA
jgi:site-specific recombinase XerD